MLGLRRPQGGAQPQPASASQISWSCTGAKCRMTHQTQIVNDVVSDMLRPVHQSDSQTLSATSNISSQSVLQGLNHQHAMRKTQLQLLTGKPSATKLSRSLRWNTTSLHVASFLFGVRMGHRCAFHKKIHPISARHNFCLSGKQKRSRQKAIVRSSTREKVYSFGLMVLVLTNAYTDQTQLQEPTAKRVEFSAELRQTVASGRLMSGSVRAADNKVAVMLDRNPLNSESFCRA